MKNYDEQGAQNPGRRRSDELCEGCQQKAIHAGEAWAERELDALKTPREDQDRHRRSTINDALPFVTKCTLDKNACESREIAELINDVAGATWAEAILHAERLAGMISEEE